MRDLVHNRRDRDEIEQTVEELQEDPEYGFPAWNRWVAETQGRVDALENFDADEITYKMKEDYDGWTNATIVNHDYSPSRIRSFLKRLLR